LKKVSESEGRDSATAVFRTGYQKSIKPTKKQVQALTSGSDGRGKKSNGIVLVSARSSNESGNPSFEKKGSPSVPRAEWTVPELMAENDRLNSKMQALETHARRLEHKIEMLSDALSEGYAWQKEKMMAMERLKEQLRRAEGQAMCRRLSLCSNVLRTKSGRTVQVYR
jgi:hypothetical protein